MLTSPLTIGFKATIAEPTVNVFGELYANPVGAASLTVMTTSNDTLPPELVAVTVYEAVAVTVVGVPEMIPVEISKESPSGSAGETE